MRALPCCLCLKLFIKINIIINEMIMDCPNATNLSMELNTVYFFSKGVSVAKDTDVYIILANPSLPLAT